MKTTIVFFSKEGSSRYGAQLISDKLGADLIELKEKRKGGIIKALRKKPSKLLGNPENAIKDSDIVYLVSPIWASNGVPAMNAFLKAADFNGKTVNLVTFQADPEFRDSNLVHDYMANIIIAKGGTVGKRIPLLGGAMKENPNNARIEKQINETEL